MQVKPLKITLLFLIVFSCHPEKEGKAELLEIQFSTTDASELFFKNVRKSYYFIEEMKTAGLEVYILKSSPRGLLQPVIVLNWRADQAFIMLQPADTLDEELKIIIRGESIDSLFFDGRDRGHHAQVALTIYNAILDKRKLSLMHKKNEYPLFTSRKEEEAFRITAFDFLRLTEVL